MPPIIPSLQTLAAKRKEGTAREGKTSRGNSFGYSASRRRNTLPPCGNGIQCTNVVQTRRFQCRACTKLIPGRFTMPTVAISVDCEAANAGKCYTRELVRVAEEFTVPLTWLIFVSEKDPMSNINLYHNEYFHRIPAWH